jgi:hypothetical protein
LNLRGVPGGLFGGELRGVLLFRGEVAGEFVGELRGEFNGDCSGEFDGDPNGVPGTGTVTPGTAPCCRRLALNALAIACACVQFILLLIRGSPGGPSTDAKFECASRLSVPVGCARALPNDVLRGRPGGSPCWLGLGLSLKLFDRFRSLMVAPRVR